MFTCRREKTEIIWSLKNVSREICPKFKFCKVEKVWKFVKVFVAEIRKFTHSGEFKKLNLSSRKKLTEEFCRKFLWKFYSSTREVCRRYQLWKFESFLSVATESLKSFHSLTWENWLKSLKFSIRRHKNIWIISFVNWESWLKCSSSRTLKVFYPSSQKDYRTVSSKNWKVSICRKNRLKLSDNFYEKDCGCLLIATAKFKFGKFTRRRRKFIE